MAQSLAKLWIHIIFSTKNRYPFLLDPMIRQRVHAYIKAICYKQNHDTAIVGGIEDHVHVLTILPKNIALSSFIEEIKKSSSKWIKTIDPHNETLKNFYWQNGYGAFSVSRSNLESVKRYIQNQQAHHRKQHFQDEFKEFLIQYDVAYKEAYLWNE